MLRKHLLKRLIDFTTIFTFCVELLCESSRKSSVSGNIGASSQIYFQNGRGITDLKEAYKTRSEATNNGWTVNNCVPGMGWHNFYAVDTYEDHNCNQVQPTCILFDENDEMLGFCLTYPANATSSAYEHPSPAGIQVLTYLSLSCASFEFLEGFRKLKVKKNLSLRKFKNKLHSKVW